jgi:uncharacterized protein (TIGR04255 family)
MPSKKYNNPPLNEAIFEYFYQSNNWTPATPGLFFEAVKKDYPIIMQVPMGLGFVFGPGGLQLDGAGSSITQYRSEDGSRVIQISNGMLTVNKLPKYAGWNAYRDSILYAIKSLKQVLNVTKVTRLNLRTLNKIDIKVHSFTNYKRYFTITPSAPESLVEDWNSIQINLETPINNGTDFRVITINTILKEPKYEAPALLQLQRARVKEIELINVESWIEEAHLDLKRLFEESLTQECKQGFDLVQD